MLAVALASADGNPLFLEERLAEMLEAGTLVRHQGAWRLREPGQLRPCPSCLSGLSGPASTGSARAAADAIRAAAVLGTEFTAGLLAATARHDTGRACPGP